MCCACDFLIIKLQVALYHAMQLLHFVSGFGAI